MPPNLRPNLALLCRAPTHMGRPPHQGCGQLMAQWDQHLCARLWLQTSGYSPVMARHPHQARPVCILLSWSFLFSSPLYVMCYLHDQRKVTIIMLFKWKYRSRVWGRVSLSPTNTFPALTPYFHLPSMAWRIERKYFENIAARSFTKYIVDSFLWYT